LKSMFLFKANFLLQCRDNQHDDTQHTDPLRFTTLVVLPKEFISFLLFLTFLQQHSANLNISEVIEINGFFCQGKHPMTVP
jgi:hypothetical protein